MEKYYTIGDVAARTGISAHTLRYYDKEGLLSFVKRSESGTRLFTKEDFEPLYTITVLKKSGMPIRKIREFMTLYLQGNKTIHDRYVMFNEQRKSLLEQIAELEAADNAPETNAEAARQLLATDFEKSYTEWSDADKRRFWRGILKAIYFNKDRTIDPDFLL